ncbi:MAG: HAMP domain-containing protein [Burkholderiaceae bacterium]
MTRFKFVLSVLALGLALTAILGWQGLGDARRHLADEAALARALALAHLTHGAAGEPAERLLAMPAVAGFSLLLRDSGDRELARLPAADASGERAPAWYRDLVWPQSPAVSAGPDGQPPMLVADPDGALLAPWRAWRNLLLIMLAGTVLIAALVWREVGRLCAAATRLRSAMADLGRGALDTRLPVLAGREGRLLAESFNRMAGAVEEGRRAAESNARVSTEQRVSAALTEAMHEREQAQREALARDIHGELGLHLASIRSMGEAMRQRIGDRDSPLAQASELIIASADRIDAGSRAIIERLRPASLERVALPDALSGMVADLRRAHPERQFTLRLAPGAESVAAAAASAAYRVAQEALTNSLRHSGASAIALNLRVQDGLLVLQVDDNGRGAQEAPANPTGNGLAMMREWAEQAGGRLDLARSRQGGVTVRLSVPLNDAGPSEQSDAGSNDDHLGREAA